MLLEEHGDADVLRDFQSSWVVVRANALLLGRHRQIAENRALIAALESMCRAAPLSGQVHLDEIARIQQLHDALDAEHTSLNESVAALEAVVANGGKGEGAGEVD